MKTKEANFNPKNVQISHRVYYSGRVSEIVVFFLLARLYRNI